MITMIIISDQNHCECWRNVYSYLKNSFDSLDKPLVDQRDLHCLECVANVKKQCSVPPALRFSWYLLIGDFIMWPRSVSHYVHYLSLHEHGCNFPYSHKAWINLWESQETKKRKQLTKKRKQLNVQIVSLSWQLMIVEILLIISKRYACTLSDSWKPGVYFNFHGLWNMALQNNHHSCYYSSSPIKQNKTNQKHSKQQVIDVSYNWAYYLLVEVVIGDIFYLNIYIFINISWRKVLFDWHEPIMKVQWAMSAALHPWPCRQQVEYVTAGKTFQISFCPLFMLHDSQMPSNMCIRIMCLQEEEEEQPEEQTSVKEETAEQEIPNWTGERGHKQNTTLRLHLQS